MLIIYTRPLDTPELPVGVSVIVPAPKERLERELGPLTDEEYKAKIWSTVPSDAINPMEITLADVPTNRKLRNAWIHDTDNKKAVIHPDKARAVIREKRNLKLDALDSKAFSESRKPKGDLTAINTEAQRLRDIPQHPLFNSNDPADLETVFDSV